MQENYAIPSVKGFTEVIQIGDPGAGNDFVFDAAAANDLWRFQLLSVHFRFSTDATVVGRYVGLRFHNTDDTFNFFYLLNPIPQTASLNRRYNFAKNFPCQPWWATGTAALPETYSYLPLPDLEFTREQRFTGTAENMQGNDELTEIAIMIRRWKDENI